MTAEMTRLTFLMWQALDAPWPIIQANAIYFSSCMLSLSDDQHILTLYYPQVIFRHELSFYVITKTNMACSQKLCLHLGIWNISRQNE